MRHLSNFKVSEYLLKNNIKNDTELLALANIQKEEGKTDLAEFILKKTPKALNELIGCTWQMKKHPVESPVPTNHKLKLLLRLLERIVLHSVVVNG